MLKNTSTGWILPVLYGSRYGNNTFPPFSIVFLYSLLCSVRSDADRKSVLQSVMILYMDF